MSVVSAFWSRLLRPLKILFWVIVGIVVIGVIWLAVRSEPTDLKVVSIASIECRDVPDSMVVSGYAVLPAYIEDEWGDRVEVYGYVEFKCPGGTRRRYGLHPGRSKVYPYLSGIPDSLYCECWTSKTVCDTVWREES